MFDEPNPVADAGLVPLVRLAERLGLPGLIADRIRIDRAGNSGGANPAAKAMSPVAAMCAGADSIDDADRLRRGAMNVLFSGVRAPSTPGHVPGRPARPAPSWCARTASSTTPPHGG
ncbi:hypothetical protein [Streptomyces xinghaiensis]|uniref:hypothetical protein n=1 Tax=Streptomyces xinghaiensis TaxID=1038928 RepID=UPI0034441B66